MSKMPKKIIPLKNKDKTDHETWIKGRGMLNIPSPYFMLLVGPRNCGKSNFIMNLLGHADPPFDDGYVIHFDAEGTSEYDDSGLTVLPPEELPSNKDIEKEGKKIIIFEDIPFESLSKEQKINLQGLIKYSISHKNTSIIWTTHDYITGLPAPYRRLCSVFVIYKMPDISSLTYIGNRCGMKTSEFLDVFKQFCVNCHDNIMVDLTKDSPYPLRYNVFHPIKILDDE